MEAIRQQIEQQEPIEKWKLTEELLDRIAETFTSHPE